jgi:peptidoglycan/LPS O-acetylase OafA/YrhL
LRYNPALDGLRAVAIILVLATHYSSTAFPGGWIGVDVFFVLSGYLITSILLREIREKGGIDFTKFYARRAIRLMPPLLLTCLAILVISMRSSHGEDIRRYLLFTVSYLLNWKPLLPVNDSVNSMDHTWSLATEEQFYILWPLALPFIMTLRRPIVALLGATVAMTFVRFAFWHFWDFGDGEWLLKFSLLRPVGLLVGCALAFLPLRQWRSPIAVQSALVVGLGVMALCPIYADSLWGPLAASLISAGLIVCLQGPSFLAMSPLRYIGKISYGIYLYHCPIVIYGRPYTSSLLLIGLSVIVAALSYEFFEKPILGLKARFQPRNETDLPEGGIVAQS